MSIENYIDYCVFTKDHPSYQEDNHDILQDIDSLNDLLVPDQFGNKYARACVVADLLEKLIQYSLSLGLDIESVFESRMYSYYTNIFEPDEDCQDDLLYYEDKDGIDPEIRSLVGGYFVVIDKSTQEILPPLKFVSTQINEEHFNY